jgi:hypothetical protein
MVSTTLINSKQQSPNNITDRENKIIRYVSFDRSSTNNTSKSSNIIKKEVSLPILKDRDNLSGGGGGSNNNLLKRKENTFTSTSSYSRTSAPNSTATNRKKDDRIPKMSNGSRKLIGYTILPTKQSSTQSKKPINSSSSLLRKQNSNQFIEYDYEKSNMSNLIMNNNGEEDEEVDVEEEEDDDEGYEIVYDSNNPKLDDQMIMTTSSSSSSSAAPNTGKSNQFGISNSFYL